MGVLCNLKIKIEPKFGTYVYQRRVTLSKLGQDAELQSGTSSILQSPKSGLKGHGCSLHGQNQDRAKIWNMNISKTSDHIQIKFNMPTPVRNLQHPPKS